MIRLCLFFLLTISSVIPDIKADPNLFNGFGAFEDTENDPDEWWIPLRNDWSELNYTLPEAGGFDLVIVHHPTFKLPEENRVRLVNAASWLMNRVEEILNDPLKKAHYERCIARNGTEYKAYQHPLVRFRELFFDRYFRIQIRTDVCGDSRGWIGCALLNTHPHFYYMAINPDFFIDDDVSKVYLASVIFHEGLHNIGWMHGRSDFSTEIGAAQDCLVNMDLDWSKNPLEASNWYSNTDFSEWKSVRFSYSGKELDFNNSCSTFYVKEGDIRVAGPSIGRGHGCYAGKRLNVDLIDKKIKITAIYRNIFGCSKLMIDNWSKQTAEFESDYTCSDQPLKVEAEITLSSENEYMVVVASDKDSRVEIYSIKIEDLSYD